MSVDAHKRKVPSEEGLSCPVGVARCEHLSALAALRQEVQALRAEVRHDALTGAYNYRSFGELVGQEMERAQRSGLPLALAMVDIDHFKRVNDRYGHENGNRVLKQVARVLLNGVRRIDAVCRYGGEEFALILPATHLTRAAKAAERMRAGIAETEVATGAGVVRISASFGIAVYPYPGIASVDALVEAADAQLYRAKSEGRNRVCHVPVEQAPADTQVSADEKRALLE